MKKTTKIIIGMLAFFFLSAVPVLVLAEEDEVSSEYLSAHEVESWEEKYLVTRLDNGMYLFRYINPDRNAKVKEAFGLVDLVLTQAIPTFEADAVLRSYTYTQDTITYLFKYENGVYVGGPVKVPYFLQEDEPEGEEKSTEPSKSAPEPSSPTPPKEKEVGGGKGEKMYS